MPNYTGEVLRNLESESRPDTWDDRYARPRRKRQRYRRAPSTTVCHQFAVDASPAQTGASLPAPPTDAASCTEQTTTPSAVSDAPPMLRIRDTPAVRRSLTELARAVHP